MEKLAPLYRRHLCSNLLTHMRNKHIEPTEPRPLIQSPVRISHKHFYTFQGIFIETHNISILSVAGAQRDSNLDPVLQDAVAHAEIMLEGTLPQYLEGIWTHRHLQVTNSFTVESRDTKEVSTEIHVQIYLIYCVVFCVHAYMYIFATYAPGIWRWLGV